MKSFLLISSLVIAVSSALAVPNAPSTPPAPPAPPAAPAAPEAPAAPKPPAAVSASSHVTVTIESGGKKETHEIDLGNAPTLKIEGPLKLENDTATPHRGGAGASNSPLEFTGAVKLLGGATASSAQFTSGPAPWLGVTVDEVSEELRAQLPIEPGAGLLVRTVVPESPAAQAGFQKNDVLVELDDQLLINGNQLSALVRMKKDGEKVRLTYFRGGKRSTAEAQIRVHEGSTGAGNIFFGDSNNGLTSSSVSSFSGMVLTDKDGHVLISRTPPDLTAVTAQVEKILRAAGVDDKTIAETELTIEKAAKAASSAVSSIENAGGDAASQIKNATDQVAKSLEKARAAAEQARRKAEEARERAEKLGKQPDPKKDPPAQ